MRFSSDFLHSKVTWTAIVAIVAAVAGWTTGELSVAQTVAAIFAALQTMWLRDTIAKTGG